jgi:hypothetical protein
MDAYVQRIRPKPEIRHAVDLAYRISGKRVEIFETRTVRTSGTVERPIAKATYVRTTGTWKVFWLRQDLRWHAYKTKEVETIQEFIALVERDEWHCFWG